MTADIKVSFFR